MKMQLLNLAMVIMIATGIYGQKPGKREKIEAMKVAFITNELQLTPEESQSFWPLYNNFKKELEALRPIPTKRPDLDNISDEQAQAMLNTMMEREAKMLDVKQRYIQKASQVLPPSKVLKLFIAEKKFKRRLIQHLAKTKRNRKRK